MKSASIEEVLSNLYYLSEEERIKVKMAYLYAKDKHFGQYRKSGEEYITHPLTVAYILSLWHADFDTIVAGLLHDTLEDTPTTKKEIEVIFNKDISNIVDGVTKMDLINFKSKEAQDYANIRKIMLSIIDDIRIFIVKLADNLHNMSTLEYMSIEKQKRNALESREIYIPIAYHIGAYRIKKKLEDLTMQYIENDEYKKISETMERKKEEMKPQMDEMIHVIKRELDFAYIENILDTRVKNIYGIYERLRDGHSIDDIHDLFVIKVILERISDCYTTLGLIHSKYPPVNSKFKDYISNPKTNMYRSLHTTLFSNDRLVQAQIRTKEMDEVAAHGIFAYWDIYEKDATKHMQSDIKEFQFFDTLEQIDSVYESDKDFVSSLKEELFKDKVYVCTPKGMNIELPRGATAIDFAYKIHSDIGNNMVGVYINDIYTTDFSYKLKNKDIVRVVTSKDAKGPTEEWLTNIKTTNAKKKVKEKLKEN